jgi:hypothetical protein
MDRFVGGCVGWIAARDPRARFVGGQVGYAEPVHSRFVGGQVGFVTTTVTPASRYSALLGRETLRLSCSRRAERPLTYVRCSGCSTPRLRPGRLPRR